MKRSLARLGVTKGLSLVLIVAIVSVVGVRLLRPSHAQTPPATCKATMSAILVPSCGALWGFYSNPKVGGDTVALQSKYFGRQFDIIKFYHDMSNTSNGIFPDTEEKQIAANGQILHIAWDPRNYSSPGSGLPTPVAQCRSDKPKVYSYAQITSGVFDSYIQARARDVAALGKPVIMDWLHEPDNGGHNCPQSATSPGTPAQGSAAYRHVITTFRNYYTQHHLVNNVVWAYVTTGYLNDSTKAYDAAFYPGDSYIDWIGWDPYIHTGTSTNRTAESSWGTYYHWVQGGGLGSGASSKPFMLGEYGVGSVPEGEVSTYMGSIIKSLKDLPQLKAIEYYNTGSWAQMTTNFYDQTAIDGFTTAGHDPYVNTYQFGGSITKYPPTITLTSPANNTSLTAGATAPLSLAATASSQQGMSKVVFSYKASGASSWTTLATDTASPFSASWDYHALPQGSYVIQAVATDKANLTASASATVTIGAPQVTEPDFVVTNVIALPTAPNNGDKVLFSATVKNQGTADVPAGKTVGISWSVDGTKLSWNTFTSLAPGATITLAGSNAVNGVTSASWAATPGNHTITATVDDTQHVTELNEANNTSQPLQLNVPSPPPPGAPQAPTGLNSPSQTASTINLAWTASKPGTNGAPASQFVYHVKRSGQTLPPTAAAAVTYADNGLAPGTTYAYSVYASDPQGRQSADSASITATTKKLNCAAPAAPGGFKATLNGSTAVTLSWNAVSAAAPCSIDHYLVQKGSQTIAQLSGTSYSVTGLVPGTAYSFTILAVTNDSTPGARSTANATTPAMQDTTPPTAPTNLVALPVSSSQVNLTWTAASDPESNIKQYQVLRNDKVIGTTASTSFGDSGLSAGTNYKYVIVAVNGATPSLSTASASASATTLDDTIAPATNSNGGTGSDTNNPSPDIPILEDTSSVGTGSDATSDDASSTSHSYDPTSGDPVSDNPGAALTSADSSSDPTLTQAQREAAGVSSKTSVSKPIRLVAAVGGSGFIIGAGVVIAWIIRRWMRAQYAPNQLLPPMS